MRARFFRFVAFSLSIGFLSSASRSDDLPPEVKSIITKLKEDMKSKAPATRASAFKALGDLGTKATTERRIMCEGMLDSAPAVKTAAADCLKSVDPSMYKTALAIYIEKDVKAIDAVHKYGRANAALVPLILKVANDFSPKASSVKSEDLEARHMLSTCVNTLVAIDPDDPGVNQAVITMLSNPVPSLRAVAVNHVSQLKNKKLALTALVAISTNRKEEDGTRVKAIKLASGLADENTKPTVKKALEPFRFDDTKAVREAVEAALKKLN